MVSLLKPFSLKSKRERSMVTRMTTNHGDEHLDDQHTDRDDDHLDDPLPILDSFEPRAVEPARLRPTEWHQPINRNNLLLPILTSRGKDLNLQQIGPFQFKKHMELPRQLNIHNNTRNILLLPIFPRFQGHGTVSIQEIQIRLHFYCDGHTNS